MIRVLSLGLVFLLTNGCDGLFMNFNMISLQATQKKSQAEQNKIFSRPLEVATIAGPLTYRTAGKGSYHLVYGLEHDLLKAFASVHGYDLKFKVYRNENEAIEAVSLGRADLMSIRAGDHLRKTYDFRQSPAFSEQSLVLVCHRLSEVKAEKTMAGSSWRISHLEAKKWKSLEGAVVSDKSPFYFAKKVLARQIDCTWMDDQEANFVFSKHSFSLVKKELPIQRTYHFYFNSKQSSLASEMNSWLRRSMRSGEMARIHHRYRGHIEELNFQDRNQFLKRLASEFKNFEQDFKTFAGKYQISWQLVAAVAYQESQWRPEAISHKGAMGMMQLMPETAQFLGVVDITDTNDNISGGAKYLNYLYSRFPKDIAHREKMALALAAYNIGYAHLLDAQAIAVEMGKDPYAWKDIQQILPLLSKPDYYTRIKYGFARGEETVDFVKRVLSYYDLLTTTI